MFAERGLDATMDEVARRAGVGVGTAYRRFRNRDDLIAALFEERLDEFMGLLDESLADSDPWRGLSSLPRALDGDAGRRPRLQGAAAAERRGPERMRRFRARIRPLVAELVRRARDAGELRADVVEDDVLLVSLMTGAVNDFAHATSSRSCGAARSRCCSTGCARPARPPLPVGPLERRAGRPRNGRLRPGRR